MYIDPGLLAQSKLLFAPDVAVVCLFLPSFYMQADPAEPGAI